MKPDGMFIKLMMMTTSDNDGEALVALRKANKILKEAKVNWAELLSQPKVDNSFRVPPSKRPQTQPKPKPKWEEFGDDEKFDGPEIDDYFNTIFKSKMSDSFAEFIESVHTWWQVHHFLTKAQYRTIKKSAERNS